MNVPVGGSSFLAFPVRIAAIRWLGGVEAVDVVLEVEHDGT